MDVQASNTVCSRPSFCPRGAQFTSQTTPSLVMSLPLGLNIHHCQGQPNPSRRFPYARPRKEKRVLPSSPFLPFGLSAALSPPTCSCLLIEGIASECLVKSQKQNQKATSCCSSPVSQFSGSFAKRSWMDRSAAGKDIIRLNSFPKQCTTFFCFSFLSYM